MEVAESGTRLDRASLRCLYFRHHRCFHSMGYPSYSAVDNATVKALTLAAKSINDNYYSHSSTRYDSNYYALPWFRCPSYLIGIIFGWFLHQIKGSLVTLKKVAPFIYLAWHPNKCLRVVLVGRGRWLASGYSDMSAGRLRTDTLYGRKNPRAGRGACVLRRFPPPSVDHRHCLGHLRLP